jgi:hypothetical protein
MHSRLRCAARYVLLSCALFALAARAELVEIPVIQELQPTELEVFPTPEEFTPPGFGEDVALEGHRALISLPQARGGAGRVATFRRNTAGQWVRGANLQFIGVPNGARSVELRAGIALVASRDSLYVFRPVGNTWQQAQRFAVDTGEAIAALHYDGETAVLGTKANPTFPGAAYVFTINRLGAARRQKLLSPSGLGSDDFGSSVAVSGPQVVVGAPGFNGAQGAVYVYQFGGSRWTQRQVLVAPHAEAFARFGDALAVGQGVVMVGAPGAEPERNEFGQAVRQGVVSVFALRKGMLAQVQKLRPTAGDAPDFIAFGSHIGMSGRHVVVGAPGDRFSAGTLIVYTRSGGSLIATHRMSDNEALGFNFTISGNTVIAGLLEPSFFVGRALVYELPSTP